MFTNLIESDSHTKEFKRRSSFFFATVAVYTLIFSAAGIFGILAFDAQVEAQNTDLVLEYLIPPVKPVEHRETAREVRPARRLPPNAPVDEHLNKPIRTQPPVALVTDSTKPPDTIGTTASSVPPSNVPVDIGNRNADPPGTPSGTETGKETGPATGGTPPQVADPPRVVEREKPPTQRVSTGVLAAKALSLPAPAYPLMAKQMKAQGPVNVQILVDESGRVVSAQAVKGHPMLMRAAEDAARRARFTPTLLSNQPVKVQGVIIYNFVLQ